MRAVLIKEHGAPESVHIEDVATPALRPDEVLLNICAAGVNYPDLLVIEGTYQLLPQRPFSPGMDAAGIVAEIGAEVTTCKLGDRVVVQVEHGAYAEQVAVQQDNCFRIPAEMTFVDAAAMGLAYQTAYFALLERGRYNSGETVLVNGAGGGVGLAAVQIAKALGATVFAGVTNDSQAALVLRSGADRIIRLDRPDLHESLRRQVHEINDGRGVDIVLDPLGGDVFDASLRALAWCGRMVVIGFSAGRIPQVKTNYLLLKNISVSGLRWSDYRENLPEQVRRVQNHLFDLYQHGLIKPNVMQTFAMHDFAKALKLLKNRMVEGKLVLLTNHNQGN